MSSDNLLGEIHQILHAVKDDANELQKILDFMHENVIIENPVDDEMETPIPAQYGQIIKSIASSIDAGLVCFLNPDTLEIEEIPQGFIDDPEENELITGISVDELDLKYPKWERYICIEPLESGESFKIMDRFVQSLSDEKYKNILYNALQNRKPFANFKRIIDNSPYRNDWFNFKDKWLQRYVKYFVMG